MTKRRAVRMGQHAWLLLATVVTELLVIRKWGKHIYTKPFPKHVKWAWTVGATILILYPTIAVFKCLLQILCLLNCL